MSPEILRQLVHILPNDVLSKLHDVIQFEVIRRDPPNGPVGLAGPSYQDLVDQYGIDGNAKLNLPLAGYPEPAGFAGAVLGEPDRPYLLADLPESTFYDDTLTMFVYTPTGHVATGLREMVSKELGFPAEYLKSVELLINPNLEKDSTVGVRVITDSQSWSRDFMHPLKWVVEYIRDVEHKVIRFPETIPLRPVVFGEGAQLLKEFNGKPVVTEMELFGEVYQIAPVLIDKSIDLLSASTLGALAKDGYISDRSKPSRSMVASSAYVQVGNHLVRMMTKTSPYASFCPAEYTSPSMVLSLKASVILKKDDLDTFGDTFDFMELLEDDDTVTVIIDVTGLFHPMNGGLIFGARPVTVKGTGSKNAEHIARLIGTSSRVLAVEPVGEVDVLDS